MRLPARLRATFELVPPAATSAADIGSGHGALAMALAGRGLRVVATERSPRALALLTRDVERWHRGTGLAVEVRPGDGLSALAPHEVEVVVVAGLGGRSLLRILEAAAWLPPSLVLQPMQDAHLVADWLEDRGWPAHESRIAQAGRWYLGWRVDVPAWAQQAA